MKRRLRTALVAAAVLCLVLGAAALALSAFVKKNAAPYLLTAEEAAGSGADCILVLGCGVRPDGEPSLMLRDRLDMGLRLYDAGAAPKLLMSGDHGRTDYDEVGAMKRYAMDRNVPSSDVFQDHAGFSTYESMYRARDVFCAEKILIVSQSYHLYRAVYDARALGLDAWGVAAEDVRIWPRQAAKIRKKHRKQSMQWQEFWKDSSNKNRILRGMTAGKVFF